MNAPLRTLLVGGAVRDLQLGLVPADRDWLVLGETDASMRARGFKRVGKQFQSYLHPTTGEEYALPRGFSDAEEQAGHDEVHADLAARDLTINAMALTDDQMLIDPFGGQNDLADKVLRHVSPRFADDPLRVMRVVRFAGQLGFSVAPETAALCQQICRDGRFDEVPGERIERDWTRAVQRPYIPHMLSALHSTGAGASLFDWADGPPASVEQALRRAQLAELPSEQLTAVCFSAVADQDIGAISKRLGLNDRTTRLAKLVHPTLTLFRKRELESGDVLHFAELVDGFRQSSVMIPALNVCAVLAETLGAGVSAIRERRLAIEDAIVAAAACDTAALRGQGLSGVQLGRGLRQLRKQAVAASLATRTGK